MKGIKKLLILLALVTALSLVSVGAALAAAPSVQYWAKPGDAGYEIPHGGYNTSTDACLQCHDVHESAGDYVLMRWATVTQVCASCHSLYQQKPSGLNGSPATSLGKYLSEPGNYPTSNTIPTYDPGFAGEKIVVGVKNFAGNNLMISTSSQYAVYEVPPSEKGIYGAASPATGNVRGGHRLSQGAGQIKFANGVTSTGDYIPGGSNSVTAIKAADYDNTVSAMNFRATDGLFCASCHTPHGNFGQMLLGSDNTPGDLSDNPTISTKLLSAKPNHTKARLFIDAKKGWVNGGGQWCGACHDRRLPGAVYHNHPDSACLSCHGNYVGTNADYTDSTKDKDFPHTSKVPYLLTNEPDDLCITCHVPGTLP